MKHNASYNFISQCTEGNALHFTRKHTHLFWKKEMNALFSFIFLLHSFSASTLSAFPTFPLRSIASKQERSNTEWGTNRVGRYGKKQAKSLQNSAHKSLITNRVKKIHVELLDRKCMILEKYGCIFFSQNKRIGRRIPKQSALLTKQ